MASGPSYASALSFKATTISVANTIVSLKTGATLGSRLARYRVQSQAAVVAGNVNVYLKKSGGSFLLFKSYPVIVSAGVLEVADIDGYRTENGLTLESADEMGFATDVAQAFNVFCWFGDIV